MKIAFIHTDKKIGTGAHYINDLISLKLREKGVRIKHFYPRTTLIDSPRHLKGLSNILFFYSLLERKREILQYSLIQGTTYTPLPFLAFPIPVVTHFGSTTRGFLDAVPYAKGMEENTKAIWYGLRNGKIISELNIKTRRSLRDIAEIEQYVASQATAVIAASEKVKQELIMMGVESQKIVVIHNAIEDYWFEQPLAPLSQKQPQLVFLGRIGKDVFTLKLKGVDRLIQLCTAFPKMKKTLIYMTTHKKLKNWMKEHLAYCTTFVNLKKDLIPRVLRPLRGSILFIPSRYEGFSLSLVEGMSQGLIPVVYPVGVAPEIIINGENGFLVNNQNDAIRRVKTILRNAKLRDGLSRCAFETALQFKSDLFANRLYNFYRDLLRKENHR